MPAIRFIRIAAPALALAAGLAAAPSHPAYATPPRPRNEVAAAPAPLPSPEAVLLKAIEVFHERRLPPYISYTLVRKQKTEQGYPDYTGSYNVHVWCRTADNAALTRMSYRDDYDGPLAFQRVAFNEDEDPGPPTADLFQKSPPRSQRGQPVPEPAISAPPIISSVRVRVNTDYKATAVSYEAGLIHLSVVPFRDVERNRLREIYLDPKTYELRKVVATDRLFIEGGDQNGSVYGVTFTIDLEDMNGLPVVTYINGIVGDGYSGDGQRVQYWFKNIQFPSSLPGWYFDPTQYAQHINEAPT